MRVGIVDDNPDIREVLTLTLTMNGHQVSAYPTGEALLESLPAHHAPCPYDLLVLDLLLPGMSGEEIIRWIRERYPVKQVPILLISGAGQQALQSVRTRFPDVACMQKPFSMQQFVKTVARLCSQASGVS